MVRWRGEEKGVLDSVRKDIIRTFVKAFRSAAGKTYVCRINEGLRRNNDKEGSSKKRPEEDKTSVTPLFSNNNY